MYRVVSYFEREAKRRQTHTFHVLPFGTGQMWTFRGGEQNIEYNLDDFDPP